MSSLSHGETTGALAVLASIKTLGGPENGAAVLEEALGAVAQLTERGDLQGEEARYARAAVLGRVWQGMGGSTDGPDRFGQRDWWVARFRALGWFHLWERSGRSEVPAMLFRGATADKRWGLAWTGDSSLAAWFASRCGGAVWCLDRPQESRLLAALPIDVAEVGTGRVEYLVDAAGLQPREAWWLA